MERITRTSAGGWTGSSRGNRDGGGQSDRDTGNMRERIAPALGETAALVERLEFHPTEDPDPNPHPDPNPIRTSTRARRWPADVPHRGRPFARSPRPHLRDGDRCPQDHGCAAGGARAHAAVSPDVAPYLEHGCAWGSRSRGDLKPWPRYCRPRSRRGRGHPRHADARRGTPVWRFRQEGGKLVGKPRDPEPRSDSIACSRSRAAIRRDSVRIDRRGRVVHTGPQHKDTLQSLQCESRGGQAATGRPRRVGEWIIVARQTAAD